MTVHDAVSHQAAAVADLHVGTDIDKGTDFHAVADDEVAADAVEPVLAPANAGAEAGDGGVVRVLVGALHGRAVADDGAVDERQRAELLGVAVEVLRGAERDVDAPGGGEGVLAEVDGREEDGMAGPFTDLVGARREVDVGDGVVFGERDGVGARAEEDGVAGAGAGVGDGSAGDLDAGDHAKGLEGGADEPVGGLFEGAAGRVGPDVDIGGNGERGEKGGGREREGAEVVFHSVAFCGRSAGRRSTGK